MKKGIVYIVLIAYVALLCKPVMPYVADEIAHAFWYSQHMATIHVENGKYHVHKQVVEESKKATPNKDIELLKKYSSESEYLIFSIASTSQKYTLVNDKKFTGVIFSICNQVLDIDAPPPKRLV